MTTDPRARAVEAAVRMLSDPIGPNAADFVDAILAAARASIAAEILAGFRAELAAAREPSAPESSPLACVDCGHPRAGHFASDGSCQFCNAKCPSIAREPSAAAEPEPAAPKSVTYWLIEYREDGRTVGYLKDAQRGDGGIDVHMTRESSRALRFGSESDARSIIEDAAFQRTVPNADRFVAEEHMDANGPPAAPKSATETAWESAESLIRSQGEDPAALVQQAADRVEAWRAAAPKDEAREAALWAGFTDDGEMFGTTSDPTVADEWRREGSRVERLIPADRLAALERDLSDLRAKHAASLRRIEQLTIDRDAAVRRAEANESQVARMRGDLNGVTSARSLLEDIIEDCDTLAPNVPEPARSGALLGIQVVAKQALAALAPSAAATTGEQRWGVWCIESAEGWYMVGPREPWSGTEQEARKMAEKLSHPAHRCNWRYEARPIPTGGKKNGGDHG